MQWHIRMHSNDIELFLSMRLAPITTIKSMCPCALFKIKILTYFFVSAIKSSIVLGGQKYHWVIINIK